MEEVEMIKKSSRILGILRILVACLLLLWLGLLTGCFIPINLTSLGVPAGSSGEPPSLEPLPDEKPCVPKAIAVL